jgi:phytoene synthase
LSGRRDDTKGRPGDRAAFSLPAPSAALGASAELVRRADPDRYFSALFAPAEKRHALLALYAFNVELSRIGETVHEPMLGEIRLQWWRETMESARAGQPRRHDVAEAMAQISLADLPEALFARMIDARSFDVARENFADEGELETYLRDTSGTLMQLAARVLGGTGQSDEALAKAGTAFGYVGVARALAFHARRGKNFIPDTMLKRFGVSADRLASPAGRDATITSAREMAARAAMLYGEARASLNKQEPLVAMLPATLVPLYARDIVRASWNPDGPDVGMHRRLAKLLIAATRGRI